MREAQHLSTVFFFLLSNLEHRKLLLDGMETSSLNEYLRITSNLRFWWQRRYVELNVEQHRIMCPENWETSPKELL